MARIRIESFEELAVEFNQQLDGIAKMSLKKGHRIDIETTDSAICNIMACPSGDPESALMDREERFGRQWDNNPNIQGTREAYIARMLTKSYA